MPADEQAHVRIEDRDAPMAIQQLPIAPLGHEAYHIAEHRIRRCTYRRLIAIDAGSEQIYEVECLFPDRQVSIPLGDLDSATPICNFCSAAHIFRPDED